MGSLPVLKPREAIRILERLGFSQVRQTGSHRQFRHPDGRQTTVPDHAGRDLSPSCCDRSSKTSASLPTNFCSHGSRLGRRRPRRRHGQGRPGCSLADESRFSCTHWRLRAAWLWISTERNPLGRPVSTKGIHRCHLEKSPVGPARLPPPFSGLTLAPRRAYSAGTR